MFGYCSAQSAGCGETSEWVGNKIFAQIKWQEGNQCTFVNPRGSKKFLGLTKWLVLVPCEGKNVGGLWDYNCYFFMLF